MSFTLITDLEAWGKHLERLWQKKFDPEIKKFEAHFWPEVGAVLEDVGLPIAKAMGAAALAAATTPGGTVAKALAAGISIAKSQAPAAAERAGHEMLTLAVSQLMTVPQPAAAQGAQAPNTTGALNN